MSDSTRIIRFYENGGPLLLETVAVEQPASNEVRLRIHALFLYSEGNLESQWCHRLDERFADSFIDHTAGNALANWSGMFDTVTLAHIVWHQAATPVVIANAHSFAAHGAYCQAL